MGSRRGNFRTDFVCSDDDRGVRQMERPIERLWSFNLTLILAPRCSWGREIGRKRSANLVRKANILAPLETRRQFKVRPIPSDPDGV